MELIQPLCGYVLVTLETVVATNLELCECNVFDIGLLKSIAKLTRFTPYTIKVVLFQQRLVLTDCAAQVLIDE